MSIDADLQTERGDNATALPTVEQLLSPIEAPRRRPPEPPHRSGWLAVVLVIVVVFAFAMGVMLVSARAESSDLTQQVDTLNAETAAMQSQLDQMQAQLDEANMTNELNNARVVQLDAENQELKSQVPPPPAAAGPAPGNMQVVLTFDDGPHGVHTRQAMDTLEQNGVRGVFFMLGTEVEANPEIAKEIVDRGHVVANHSWRHRDLMKLTDAEIRDDITRTNDAIERATGVRPACVRAPYGNADDRVKAVIQSMGLSTVKWNVDTLDYQKAGSAAIAAKALSQINGLGERGANVLMHDGGGDRTQTVGSLNQMIQEIKASGRQIVTICG